MKRYLSFFEPDASGAIEKALERVFQFGGRKALVIGPGSVSPELANTLRTAGLTWDESQLTTFREVDIGGADLVLVTGGTGTDVSRALQACIDRNIAVIAPVTEHHCSKRIVFLLSIPKAGTHMVIRLLGLMGLERSSDRIPLPGTWSTPPYFHYHAPCRDLMEADWFDPMGRQLFLRSPAIFVYRNPLDIVVSELNWFIRPEHAFSGYLNSYKDIGEKLDRLIADITVMGTIRDRINRYAGWMNFNNVIPVSYEELVGERGGGSDAEQTESIWAMQLKLHIPGDPEEYGARLYDPACVTFHKGRIGGHRECFEDRHFALFNSLPQDFMQALGYRSDSWISSKVKTLRQRPLVVKELPSDLLFKPRLVREGFLGWNIIEVAGRYFPVQQGVHVMSGDDGKMVYIEQEGYVALRDAEDAILHREFMNILKPKASKITGTELIVEGHSGFNIVRHNGQWCGVAQAVGAIDLNSLDEAVLDDLKKKESFVTGESLTDVKVEILRLVMQRSARHSRVETGDLDLIKEKIEQNYLILKKDLTRSHAQWEQGNLRLQKDMGKLQKQCDKLLGSLVVKFAFWIGNLFKRREY